MAFSSKKLSQTREEAFKAVNVESWVLAILYL